MTRSVLLATSFPPRVGGVETLLYQTNRRLMSPPLVLAPPPAGVADLVVHQVPTGFWGRVAYRGLWRIHPSLHYLGTFGRPAARAMHGWRPDVVQVGHVAMAPLGWLLARRAGRRFVVYAYGQEVLAPSWSRPTAPGDSFGLSTTRQPARGRPALDAWLRGAALRAADAVLTPGEFTSRLVRAWGVAAERIVAVPFGAQPRPAGPPPHGAGLLSVGRLVPRKGFDMVLRALPGLPACVTYRVVGDGPDAPRLAALARQLGVSDRVAFLGRLDDAALADEYQRCALFVQPSRRTADGQLEGLGLVFFEAAAWGRPVVAGRSGGEPDAVVDGQTGLLVDGESVESLAEAIRGLLADPDRLRRLGEQGRRRVETSHNWDRAAAVVDTVLARLA